MSREVMQQALEALKNGKRVRNADGGTQYQPTLEDAAISAIEAELNHTPDAGKMVGPISLETVYEIILQWDEGGGKRSRRELTRRIVALYAASTKEQA